MSDPEYQKKYFKQRYADHPEFRRGRQGESNAHRRRKYATDPEWRAKESARCARANRNRRLMHKHGISVDEFDAAMAAQQGACACCDKQLGRVKRVHRKADGAIGLLCQRCCKLVASLAHVRRHADGFEAYMKERGMTVELC